MVSNMSVFKPISFESNAVADAACNDFFSDKIKLKSKRNKNKIKNDNTLGLKKIEKNKTKNKFKKINKVLKNEVKNIKTNSFQNTAKLLKNKFRSKETDRGELIHCEKGLQMNNARKNNKIKQKVKVNKGDFININQNNKRFEENKQSKLNFTSSVTPVQDNRVKKDSQLKLKSKAVNLKNIKQKITKAANNGNDDTKELVKKTPLSRKDLKKEKQKEKLAQILNKSQETAIPVDSKPLKKRSYANKSLRERMMEKLTSARFRYINEQIYSNDSKEAQHLFNTDSGAFEAYHEGYRQQVNKWPVNPVDIVIKSIQKMSPSIVIADFGCGDAKIASTVVQKVHSFDLVAANDLVTACDMSHVPLESNSVDVVIFCLSLMGTNLNEYLIEANRVLKQGGTLKIAEIESRFDDVKQFIEGVKRFSFKLNWQDFSHNLFYFMDFKKESNIAAISCFATFMGKCSTASTNSCSLAFAILGNVLKPAL